MLVFSFLINSQINILVGLFAFFVENNAGMMSMKRILVDLCSGLIVPLTFFPGWAATLLEWLPFQAITYLPASVFVGRVSGDAVWGVLLIQLVWFVVLTIPIWLVWQRARRRLFVQGG
jgi:ABC-2 type transport system permease protein